MATPPSNPFSVKSDDLFGKEKEEKKPKRPLMYDVDEMEKMGLQDLEVKINELYESGKLSVHDEEIVRKVRRKVQNKWSSKEYRKRKKQSLDEMTTELNNLRNRCESLETENDDLKNRIKDLKIDFD